MPPAPALVASNNFSTLLQFLYQELLSSDDHDNTKEKLLTYFQEAGCDSTQLDIIHTSFQKATLDTKAFTAMGADKQNLAPGEFSQRLVNELTKKYKDTKELYHRINKLEELCMAADTDIPSSSSANVSLDEAMTHFSDVRLASHNLEAAMISICDQRLRSHMKGGNTSGSGSGGGGNNRHTSGYDEQILTLRKKLHVSTCVMYSFYCCVL
jgi:hypothetical protein